MKRELEKLRREYLSHGIDKNELPDDPVQLLKKWIEEALSNNVPEPNAMAVSTVSSENKPSTRIVLLKELNSNGLVFYTNYNSRKSKEIDKNPALSVLFFWPALERQVRLEGTTKKTSIDESDAYFAGRPRSSQISAWISPQSEIIASDKVLDERFRLFTKRFEGKKITRPPHWGGFRIKPSYFEFWQGRPGRLNDRVIYLQKNETWEKERLAP